MTATEELTVTSGVKIASFKIALKPSIEIATKGTLKEHPDSNKLTLEFKKDEIIVSAYGGRLASTVPISNLTVDELEYTCDVEGKVTVNASDLLRCLDSFPEKDRLLISATENELSLSRESDSEESQKLPLVKDEVVTPEIASKFQKQITIDRLQFIQGMNDVSWAVGFEDHKENYFYVRLIANKGEADFMAGTGGRFRIWHVEGEKFITCSARTEFFFHKDQISPLLSVLKNATKTTDNDFITIKQAEREGDAPDQIIFESGSLKIMFVGFDPHVKWPNIEKSIKEKKINVIETNVSDWEYPTKGLLATFNEEVKKAHDTHESAFEPKLDKNIILLTSKSGMKAQRKVQISDIKSQGEQINSLEFNCTTPYIAEIFTRCDKTDKISIEYHDSDEKPIFIVGPKKDNTASGVSTQYILFFASMKN